MFRLTQRYLVIPEILHIILLYGGGLVALFSMAVLIWGIFKKKRRKYIIGWIIVFLFSMMLVYLTTNGIIVANTMFGG